jgi:hypothetical protein
MPAIASSRYRKTTIPCPDLSQLSCTDLDTSLLQALPPELVLDRHDNSHRVGRPNLARFLQIDPSEAIRSDEMVAAQPKHGITSIVICLSPSPG